MKTAVLVDVNHLHANQIKKRVDWESLGFSLIEENSELFWLEKAKYLQVDLLLLGNLIFSNYAEMIAAVAGSGFQVPILLIDPDNQVTLPAEDAAPLVFCELEQLTTEFLRHILMGLRVADPMVGPVADPVADEQKLSTIYVQTKSFYILRLLFQTPLTDSDRKQIERCFAPPFESILIDWFTESGGGYCILLHEAPEMNILYSVKVMGDLIAAFHTQVRELGYDVQPILLSEKVNKKTAIHAYRSLAELEPYLYFCRKRIVLTELQLHSVRRLPDYLWLNKQIETIRCHLLESDIAKTMAHVDALYMQGILPTFNWDVLQYCRQHLEDSFQMFCMLQKRPMEEHKLFQDCRFLEEECDRVRRWIADNLSGVSLQYQLHKKTTSALLYLFQHYTEDISHEGVAQELQLSPAYFSKLFKRDTGQSFSEFLTGLRIQQAKSLFDVGETNVRQTAARVGFNDPKYFSRVFRRECGVSPSEYLTQRKGHVQ